MFTKKEFNLAKKLYYPLKVIELCKKHQVKVDFDSFAGNFIVYLKKGGLTAAVIVYRHADEESYPYLVERMISQLDWELIQREVKK